MQDNRTLRRRLKRQNYTLLFRLSLKRYRVSHNRYRGFLAILAILILALGNLALLPSMSTTSSVYADETFICALMLSALAIIHTGAIRSSGRYYCQRFRRSGYLLSYTGYKFAEQYRGILRDRRIDHQLKEQVELRCLEATRFYLLCSLDGGFAENAPKRTKGLSYATLNQMFRNVEIICSMLLKLADYGRAGKGLARDVQGRPTYLSCNSDTLPQYLSRVVETI